MKYTLPLIVLLILFSSIARGQTDIESMELGNQKSVSTPEGKDYEMEAIVAFWGDAKFMRECAPPDAPIADPLTIYFEITRDGLMGEILIEPDTEVAKCIKRNVKDRIFPEPTGDFVAKIDLAFTE